VLWLAAWHTLSLPLLVIDQPIFLLLLLLPAFLKFFPSRAARPMYFPRYYPLSLFRTSLTELSLAVLGSIRPTYVAMFACSFYFAGPYTHLQHLWTLLNIGMCGLLGAENLLCGIGNKRRMHVLLTILLLFAQAYLAWFVINPGWLLLLSLLEIPAMVILYVAFYEQPIPKAGAGRPRLSRFILGTSCQLTVDAGLLTIAVIALFSIYRQFNTLIKKLLQ
jgi:hypothetical protein